MLCKHLWACYISAAMTIWRMADATSREEIDSLIALHMSPLPPGIKRTIELEAQRALERLQAA
jgi:hypothetical protein